MTSSATTMVSHTALGALASAVLRSTGSDAREAAIVADHLVDANLAGHDSHGCIRLSKYVEWRANDMVLANRHARVVRAGVAHLVVDGDFGFGQVIGREAMELGVDKARTCGVCVVSIRNSGHLGRIGAWPEQVAAAGFASVHFVNTSGFGMLVAPFGGSDRRLSANPIAAGAPRRNAAPLVLDISTSAIAEGKLQVARNRGDLVPEGCVVDGAGQPTRDPQAFYGPPEGALLPFGAHKGYGLSVVCEIMAGALSGGGTTHPDNTTAHRLVNNMTSVIFDASAFCGDDVFAAEIDRLFRWVKASPPALPASEVLLPGEIEQRTRATRVREGVPIDATTLSALIRVAGEQGVAISSPFNATTSKVAR